MDVIRIEDIVEKLQANHPQADVGLVRRAYVFSAQQHKDQVRRSGEPYLTHPLEVAYILAELNLDAAAISVGLLHDVLEDTLTSRKELERYFGKDVARIVAGVTKISKIPFVSLEHKQAENFRKMMMAMVDDIQVILVKLADRLHNMRTLAHLERPKQVRIATETQEIYVPIAHRLGMGRTKQELEDLCFKFLEPEIYESIRRTVEREVPVKKAEIRKIRDRMQKEMDANSIPCAIERRIKGVHSIYFKRRKLEKKFSADYDFHDYIAYRIITDEIKHCYAALGILHNLWTPVPGQFDDYIANPKPNNYQSLHTVLVDRQRRFEVQIRTTEMHRIAEEGIAAHWHYKEGGAAPGKTDWEERYYGWLRQMLELQTETDDPQEFMRALKGDLAPREVFTFTPKGKLLALPWGAIPIDFAYAIHTDIGHTCVGAKVNGRMVSFDTELRSGDTVEIITSKGHHPNRDWLSMVKTGRARHKIRQFLNRQERQKSVEVGRRLLGKERKRHGVSLKKLQAAEGYEAVIKDLDVGGLEDLYSAIGFGRISARSFLARLFPAPEEEPKEALPKKIAKTIRKTLGLGEGEIKVMGADDLLTYIGSCCSPVYGEPIVGYVTRGKGIAVHRTDCTNIADLHPERRIAVEWARTRDSLMPASLLITTEDQQGLLAKIMAQVDKAKVNVRGLTAKTFDDKPAEISMTLEVKDIRQLNSILQSLKEVPGVLDIRRA